MGSKRSISRSKRSMVCAIRPFVCSIRPMVRVIRPFGCSIRPMVRVIRPFVCSIRPMVHVIRPLVCSIRPMVRVIPHSGNDVRVQKIDKSPASDALLKLWHLQSQGRPPRPWLALSSRRRSRLGRWKSASVRRRGRSHAQRQSGFFAYRLGILHGRLHLRGIGLVAGIPKCHGIHAQAACSSGQ
jgi:hypothetical protein